MNKDEGATPEADDYKDLLRLVAEAFVLHQTATYRRPVFRHQYGDIALTTHGLGAFIDSYLEDVGKSVSQRRDFYLTLLDWEKMNGKQKGLLHDFGQIPTLVLFGIKWISMELSQFGDMIQDMGPETANKLMGVKSGEY